MALQQGIAEQLATAYGSGDTAAVNNLLQANQVSAGDVQSFWNFTPDQMGQLGGLNFYSAPAVADTPGITYQAGDYSVPTNMGPLPTTPPPAAPPLLSPTDVISGYYDTELGRKPDIGGLGYWANQVTSGAMTLDQVRQAINASEEGAAFDRNPLTGTAALGNWLTQNPTASDAQIAYHMDLYGVSPQDATKVFTTARPEDILSRYQAAQPYVNLFNTYQAGDVAATNAALAKSGLTADQLASGFLLDPAEMQALRSQGYNLGFSTPEFTSAFAPGEDKVLGLDDLNRGFEWAQANKIDDAALKKTLGEDKYNAYTKQYGEGILSALQPVFADGKLSGQEALDIVTQAKKYGLDADEISKYTGLKPEVPKALFDGYDKTLTGIVGNLLNPEANVSTADRIKTALSLQSTYGLTDADIAKYSNGKITEAQTKGFLEPVRNFATDFQKLFSTPDVTAKDVTAFLDKSRGSEGIAALYGDKLDTVQNKIAEITPKWERFGVDPLQAETLYGQINKITEAAGGKNWSGSWMSGGDNAALEAAAMLQKRGVDSLADLKVTPAFQKNAAVEMYQGQAVQTDDQGRKFVTPYAGESDFGVTQQRTYLPAGTQTQLFSVNEYQDAGEGGGRYVDYRPLSADELKTYDPKTGKYDMAAGSQLIDASTGKVVATGGTDNRFTLDQYSTGNFFKGKDKSFGIQFTKDGVPVPFTTTEKTGLVTTPILPLLAAIFAPQLAGMLSNVLPGAAVTGGAGAAGAASGIGFIPATATNTLLSNTLAGGIVGGGTAVAQDGDFWKGFLSGGIGPLVGGVVGSMLPTDLPSGVSKAITSTAGNVASAAARGAPIEDVLKGGITSGLLNYGLDQSGLTQSLNLSPQDLKLLSGVVVPALTTGKVNPLTAISTLMPTGKP